MIEDYKFPVVNISKFYSRPGTEAAKWKKVPLKEAKDRSTKLTHLFNGYRCYDHLQDTIQRVWIFEDDNKSDENVVGHTKGYVKVLIKKKPGMDLLGEQVIVKVSSTHKWHVVGDVLDYSPEPLPIEENYFENCLKRREEQKNKLKLEYEKAQVNAAENSEDADTADASPKNAIQKSKISSTHEILFGMGLIAMGGLILYNRVSGGLF